MPNTSIHIIYIFSIIIIKNKYIIMNNKKILETKIS